MNIADKTFNNCQLNSFPMDNQPTITTKAKWGSKHDKIAEKYRKDTEEGKIKGIVLVPRD